MFFNEEQMVEHHKAKHQGDIYWAWIGQRARGVYLAHVSCDQGDVDSWDAFPTEADAKRWAAAEVGRKRLPWERADDGSLRVEEVTL